MKKSDVKDLFMDQSNRKLNIILLSLLICILFVFGVLSLNGYLAKTKDQFVNYKEDSDIDYKVYLKKNNFFKESYLGKDSEYIASLISGIDADFKYSLDLDGKAIDFNYSKRMEAEVIVKDPNSSKTLYNFKEVLKDRETSTSLSKSNLVIKENVIIDYNYYNDIVKKFKTTYGLNNVESTLVIKMYVDVVGTCSDIDGKADSGTVVSLNIPLTTKTMSIEMSSDLTNNKDNLLICKKGKKVSYLLVLSLLFVIGGIGVSIYLSLYIVRTRTVDDVYQKELKKILSNYHSFIQKVNNKFNLVGYQVLKVDTFIDMLEIRDTLQQPILIVEQQGKSEVYFIIPSNTRLLYVFSLKDYVNKKMNVKE